MKLQVKVVKAANLAAKDPNGKSDPYCHVFLGAGVEPVVHKTEVKQSTLEPEWNTTITFYEGELSPFLHSLDRFEYQVSGYVVVNVWDRDTMNQDDFMGQVMYPLREVSTTAPHEEWYPLTRRTAKEKVSGSILLEMHLKVDKMKLVDKTSMNSDLYQRCKLRGYHLPVLSGKDMVELPGRTERVEMAFSNVFVYISSNHCVAQVYLTNYRLVILSNRHTMKSVRARASSLDLSTWIALNSIMSIDTGQETIVVRKNKKKQKTRTITIHCYDIRLIKLIFTLEKKQKSTSMSMIPDTPSFVERLQSAANSSSRPFAGKFRHKPMTALGKKSKVGRRGGAPMWHVDIGRWEDLPRTHTYDACEGQINGRRQLNEAGGVADPFTRARSHSGDSYTLTRPFKTNDSGEGEESGKEVGAAPGGGVASGDGKTPPVVEDGSNNSSNNSNAKDDVARFKQANGHAVDVADLHRTLRNRKSHAFRRSQSLEDVLTALPLPSSCCDTAAAAAAKAAAAAESPAAEVDFMMVSYSEPDDVETGGEYTLIFDSDEDQSIEMSMEVRDLTPFDSQTPREGVDGRCTGGLGGSGDSLTPPRATSVLISAFLLRLESVMVNGIHYPPGLFFVQLYSGYLQLTGWDMYNFPKEMDRQEVCEDDWRLSVQNGPEYHLCSTYPQLMYVPKKIQDSVVLESAKFRSKNRIPCLVWVDSKKKNFMLRCSQPLAGKSGKHSLEDEQLIQACLNAGPPEGEMNIFDARSMVAATGNMLKGKGTENVTHYPRTRYTYLDIPNIHAVRESFESLRSLCLSSESNKWYSTLENTQWLTNLGLIIKGAVMIARYMKLQRGNALVHCSDGWDRTSQLTSLAQIIMDPYFRTMTGFMILVEKEWLAFGHKFQHRLGHPDYPNERSPVFLQFLDCVYQMLHMYPKTFEFNSHFLLRIADHLHTGWFGTFLCNCDKERHALSLYARSPSLWAHLMADRDTFLNQEYIQTKQPTIPTTNLRHFKLWEEYFLRHDPTSLGSHGWRRVMDSKDRQTTAPVQRTPSVFSDHLQESWTTDHVIWMADDKTSECLLCHSKFTAFKRKHHCRACGHIFCDDCSKNKVALSHLGYTKPERVCVECYSKLNAAQKISDTDEGFLVVKLNDSF